MYATYIAGKVMKVVIIVLLFFLAVAKCDATCIKLAKVDAFTGDVSQAQSPNGHRLAFVLRDGSRLVADLQGLKRRDKLYTTELDFAVDLNTDDCVRRRDISEVHLLANGRNGWFVSSITVSTSSDGLEYRDLTRDQEFRRWVDGNGDYLYNARDHLLTLIQTPRDRHVVDCGYAVPVCECRRSADECEFDLEVDEMRTFTSYQTFSAGGKTFRGTILGVIFNINDDGDLQPIRDNTLCSDNPNCTNPLLVDGKSYRLVFAVNGQMPGPDLIVHEAQTVIMNVKNNLAAEGVSIHWHGQHQVATPWMDGVGQVTQCPIAPNSIYQYIFKANPTGTFWYHSHTGTQRTDGLFGALIVRENEQRINSVREALEPFGLEEFQDLPGDHTLSLLDWRRESTSDIHQRVLVGSYPETPVGEVPTIDDPLHDFQRAYDGAFSGSLPYFSGLINGQGRHEDVPYNKTRLSIFNIEHGSRYRFRLIGAQTLFAYRFSIDGHTLTVVGTDGYWIKPVENVDFIIINSGERYDFFVDALNETALDNYWIRAETLEIFIDSGSLPPYESQSHVAEAILHYTQPGDTPIPSTEYESIKTRSPKPECTQSSPCRAVNCPFENFHHSYYIDCINVNELSLLLPTPHEELPDANPDPNCQDCIHFFNFNFEGFTILSSINGRSFDVPAHPPQTQNAQFLSSDGTCDLNANCNPPHIGCRCAHVVDIPYLHTVQLVLSQLGHILSADTHPIHLHGHAFHVVYVGYPEYDSDTGFISAFSTDIQCADQNCTEDGCNPFGCTQPSWRTRPAFAINETTVRKDTVIIPAGGYVVINFLSDNPGFWFLHCHIEDHVASGMALLLNEAPGRHNPPPDGLNQCGDFVWDTEAFEEALQFDPRGVVV